MPAAAQKKAPTRKETEDAVQAVAAAHVLRDATKRVKAPPPPVVVDDEEEQGSQGRGANLPLVSVLPDQGTMNSARDMLLEAKQLRERMDKDAQRLEDLKNSLVTIAEAFELKGLRYGPIALEYNGSRTKRTLDKRKLLDNGVDAKTIAASYTESKPFISARFVQINQ